MRSISVYGDDEDDSGLTADQLIAAELLSVPGRAGLTMAEVAERAHTSERSLSRWRKDKRFSEYVQRRTMTQVAEHLPDIMQTLTEKAKAGHSMKAVELFLRSTGLLQQEMIVRPAVAPEETNADIEATLQKLQDQLDSFDRMDALQEPRTTNNNEEENDK